MVLARSHDSAVAATPPPSVTMALDTLRGDPDHVDVTKGAAAFLDWVASLSAPTDAALTALRENAILLSTAGYAERAQGIIGRWRAAGQDSIPVRTVEALYSVCTRGADASHRLRRLQGTSSDADWLAVVNEMNLGRIPAALEVCRKHAWFLDDPSAGDAVSYGIWALILEGEFDAAKVVAESWRTRYSRRAPQHEHLVLRSEALMAMFQHRYADAVRLLEEAIALARAHDLAMARAFAEPALVKALACLGDDEGVAKIMASWTDSKSPVLEVYRDLSRMDVALIGEDFDTAYRFANRVLEVIRTQPAAVLHSHLLLSRLWCAGPGDYRRALDEARRVIHRYQVRRYVNQLRLTEQLVGDAPSARDVRVLAQRRDRVDEMPLSRLFLPPLGVTSADVRVDCLNGEIYLGGGGPFSLSGHPSLKRFLDGILEAEGFSIPAHALFTRTWGGEYGSESAENRLHVTGHRLRTWLEAHVEGGRDLLQIRDGQVYLDRRTDVCVVCARRAVAPADETPLDARVLQMLASGEALPARAFEVQLEVSRSALLTVLRKLLARRAIERVGAGRLTRYRAKRVS